jgi:DNA polymerase sigma
MEKLTQHQIERQDFVDNAIYHLIRKINPSDKEIAWDIEMIGEIRDVVREWMVERLKIIDEQNFYPYLEE